MNCRQRRSVRTHCVLCSQHYIQVFHQIRAERSQKERDPERSLWCWRSCEYFRLQCRQAKFTQIGWLGGIWRANRRHIVQLGGIEHVLSRESHVANVSRTRKYTNPGSDGNGFENSFFCASVAALTLRALNPYGNGKLVLLETTYTRDYHSNSIYVVALILGLMGVSLDLVTLRCTERLR